MVGQDAVNQQQVVNIVSGAIDAWLSTDWRRTTGAGGAPAGTEGGPMMMKSMLACDRTTVRYTTRHALTGAAVILGASLVLAMIGVAAKRAGWPAAGELVTSLAFPISMTVSMPFWLMKGQPWKAQVVIVGGTFVFLVVIGWLASRL
jgi:hypothetical protein